MVELIWTFQDWSVAFCSRHVLPDTLQDEPGEGFFTDGCFVLVEGEYTEEATLEIIAIGQPPCEPRDIGRFERCHAPPGSLLAYNRAGRYMDTLISWGKGQHHCLRM